MSGIVTVADISEYIAARAGVYGLIPNTNHSSSASGGTPTPIVMVPNDGDYGIYIADVQVGLLPPNTAPGGIEILLTLNTQSGGSQIILLAGLKPLPILTVGSITWYAVNRDSSDTAVVVFRAYSLSYSLFNEVQAAIAGSMQR